MTERAAAPRFPIVAWLERRTRRQVLIAAVVAGVFVLLLAAKAGATALLDRWWFAATTDAPVWRVQNIAKVELFLGAFVIVAVVLGGTVYLILRVGRRVLAPNNRAMRWYHARMGRAHQWLVAGVGIFVAWKILGAAPKVWQEWLLFLNGNDVGTSVPGTGGDLGHYLFTLPFEQIFSQFIRQLLGFCIIIAFVGHSVSGSLRWSRKHPSRRAATAHLAALGAALLLAQAVHLVVVQRPSLVLNSSGGFVGAGYTQTTVVAPALWVTACFALAGSAGLAYALLQRKWKPAVGTVGAFVVVQLVALVLLPLAVERFVVTPAKGEKQLPALGHNLDFTRSAYGLDAVITAERTVADGITSAPSSTESTLLARTPLFDPAGIATALQVLEGTQGTRITNVDLDRYTIDGEVRPMMIAARQPDRSGLPETGWVQDHLVYTHGDGIVMVPADQADANGRPDVAAQPAELTKVGPTYFGEGLDGWWSLVGTKRQQLGGTTYTGSAGVPVGSFFRRLVSATALSDIQVLLSDELTSNSELLFRRGLRDRLTTLAPFISWDSDPYPASIDGKVVWVVDGYTTSATYPYSQYFGSSGLPGGSDVATATLNYLHLAVRATIDATDGTTRLYRSPSNVDDPVLDIWQSILPRLIESADSIPASVASHLRYPKDMFIVQTSLLGRYHVADAETLFSGVERWTVSPAASSTVDDQSVAPASPVFTFALGADGQPSWSTVRSYNPGASSNPTSGRDELAALVVADNEHPDHLVLTKLTPSEGRRLSSPRVAQSAILADPELARSITLLNANGSKVQFGPMTPALLDQGLLWVRSIIVTSTGAAAAPRLQEVTAVSNGVVGTGATTLDAVGTAHR